jgi:hypothetical protein
MSGSTTLKGAGQCRQASKVCLLFWTGIMLFIYIVCQKKKSVLRSAWFLFYGDVWLFDVFALNATELTQYTTFSLKGYFAFVQSWQEQVVWFPWLHIHIHICVLHTHMFLKNICFVHIRMPPHTACVLLHIYHERVFQGMCIYIYTVFIYIYSIYIL